MNVTKIKNILSLSGICFFLLISTFTDTEAKTIEGVVLERGTRKPLKDVKVFIIEEGAQQLEAVTNSEGNFSISLPDSKTSQQTFKLIVNLGGYLKFEEELVLNEESSQKTKLELYLQKLRYQTFETTIYGKSQKRDSTAKTLDAAFAAQMPGSGGDPIKAIQNLPGVGRAQGFSSQIIIQGSAPEDTRYQIEGHEVPLIFHFGGLSSVMPAEALDKIDYLSAGYGPENGRAVGGIVGVFTKKPEQDRFHFQGFLDLLNAGVSAWGPLNQTPNYESSYYIGVRKSYIGEVLKAVFKDNEDFSLTAAPSYADLNIVYDQRLGLNDQLRLSLIASTDLLDLVVNDTSGGGLRGGFNFKTSFFRLIPTWKHEWSDTVQSRFSLGLGRDWVKVLVGESFFNLRTLVATLQAETEHTFRDTNSKFKWGMDHRLASARVELLLPQFNVIGGVLNPVINNDKDAVSTDATSDLYGFYSVYEKKIEDWTFAPGLRVDYYQPIQAVWLQSRNRIEKSLDSYSSFLLNFGTYAQAPREQEFSPNVGNPDLMMNKAFHSSLKFKKDFKEGFTRGFDLEVGPFYKNLWHQVVQSTAVVSRNGNLVPEYYNNSGSGDVMGLETLLQFNFMPWQGWVSYSLSKARASINGGESFVSQYDQTHNLNVVASYDFSNDWRLGGRFRIVSGNPFTPIESGVFDSDNQVYFPNRGVYFSERVSPFWQLDLRLDKKWVYTKWILTAYLDIQNVTNRKNVENVSYSYDYSQNENVSGLPILPTLGLKGEF